MAKIKNLTTYAIAYAMWIASFLLWVLFMFLSRTAILDILGTFYVQGGTEIGRFQRGKEVQFIDRAYLVGTGLIWLVLMIVVESYFRNGAEKGDLARRIGRIVGPELLLIFASDLTLAFVNGLGLLPWTRWLILLGELVLGGIGLWLAFKAAPPRKLSPK